MPWMVSFFGFLVIPLGVAHVVLVILQPVIVGTWCTVCLATAFAMLLMIPLALDEVVAMVQLVRRRLAAGDGFWHVFFTGGTLEGGGPDDRSPDYPTSGRRVLSAGLWGVTIPWHLVASMVLGIWLMAAPAVLGIDKPVADSHHLVGALVVTTSVIAMAELARAGRFLNVAAGVWVGVAPWLLPGANAAARGTALAIGLALVALSIPRGQILQRYGSADAVIR